MRVIGVDPGDRHVGVASLIDGEFEWAVEMGPGELIERFLCVQPPDAVAVEAFQLDPSRSRAQAGSSMRTPELIGAIKALGEARGFRVKLQQPSIRGVCTRSPFWRQVCESDRVDKIRSKHARDALIHAVYFHYFSKPG